MKLVESYIESKTGLMEDCEDTYFINDKFACVIDGATNVSDMLLDEKTPGQVAARTIKTAISTLKGPEGITEIIQTINDHYAEFYQTHNLTEKAKTTPLARPSASMIIYSKHHNKVWMIGDCQCFFDNDNYQNIKRVDEVFEEVRSIITKGELITGATKEELIENDIGFELIRPLIQKQYNFQNQSPACSLSYGVINGFHIPRELIKTIEVPDHIQEISLASDGYPVIFDTLQATENHLAEMLQIDPLCINENMGAKGIHKDNVSFDDRTYIKFEVS